MNAKKYLTQYAEKVQEIKRIEYKLSALHAEISGRGVNYDGMPRAKKITKPTEETAINLIERERQLMEARTRAAEVMCNVADSIEALDDPLHKAVLHARYIEIYENGNPRGWQKISVDLGYSEDWIKHIHQEGLTAIQAKLDEGGAGVLC